ncbi:MAG: succinate dehydrogenase cytochrome b subunit [Verrucomicrobiota bacterium]|nr:succinate dehydrogenase cytochrome b subunit [Verrucomicrobiota bacterium]
MCPLCRLLTSSLGKKYLMALSGIILTGFVLGHMLGNLQIFLAPEWINQYAYHLQHMPYGLLWVVRLVLLTSVVVHIVTAISLTLENRKARPADYEVKDTIQASYASRTMRWSGVILFGFIVFHIMHYTTKNIVDFDALEGSFKLEGVDHLVNNCYAMMYLGFSSTCVSIIYAISVFLLCKHLSHGVSSMFQSLGLRNAIWRTRLDCLARVYGWVVFLGFVSIPLAVQLDFHGVFPCLFDKSSFMHAVEAAQKCCSFTGLPL